MKIRQRLLATGLVGLNAVGCVGELTALPPAQTDLQFVATYSDHGPFGLLVEPSDSDEEPSSNNDDDVSSESAPSESEEPVADEADASTSRPLELNAADHSDDGPWIPTANSSDDDEPESRKRTSDERQRTRKALFWTGVALGAVGGAGALGTGIGGYAVQRRLDSRYDDGDLSRYDETRLNDAGDALNTTAIVSVAIGLVGLGMAAIVYGIDHAACGELARRKHRRECPQ